MELLTTIFLAAHLLAMNLASAGPLLCIWLLWNANANPEAARLGRRLAWWSAAALGLGMATGGLVILTTPTPGLWQALERFPASSYWFAGVELVFSLLCISAIALGAVAINRWGIALLALVSAANLLYHFPPMMAVIGHLAVNPHWTDESTIDRPALLKLVTDGEVLALSAHFILSSLAVAGVCAMYLIGRHYGETASESGPTTRRASMISFAATVLQVPVGIWLMMSLSGLARRELMGGGVAALAFLASILGAIVLMQRLLLAAIGPIGRGEIRCIVVLLCGVVLLMTVSLRMSRPTVVVKEPTKTASCQLARGCWSC